ncbi:MAG: 4-hydroxy-tetrahydrodipicolinate synthase [Ignavibacteria bacterium]|jgi:4-hydroxy-tetrahydrodipicolinate synthase
MFKGVGTALITPFKKDRSVNLNSLKKIVEHQLSNNIDALVVLGTTGESPVIDYEERRKIISAVIDEAIGKVPVIVGTGSNNPQHVVENNKIAKDLKADGLLIVNPYYNKGTQKSLVEHYSYIAERTSLPIVLYNVPSRTGMNVLPETVVNIHERCKNIVAVKEASGDISQIAHLMSIKPDSLSVLSGNDDQTLPIMTLGGNGVISVISNPYPAEMKLITNSILNNDMVNARNYNNKYLPMMKALFCETSPSPVKYVMNRLGLCENVLRLPMSEVSSMSAELLSEQMRLIKN